MAINDKVDDMISSLRDPEEDLRDALEEYIWSYYREYADARKLEPKIVKAMDVLIEELSGYGTGQAEELIFKTERTINARGGVVGGDGKRHKVNTLPDYVLEDEDED